MSAKLVHSLTDDNPDLQKQFGCMNGLLQLFDRRHFLASRRLSSHNRKKLLLGQTSDHGKDPSNVVHKLSGKNLVGLEKEKDRVSVDSSRTSVSSSCSSTFSSVDCNKMAQQLEPSSLSRRVSPEPSTLALPRQLPNPSLNSVQKPLDLQDVVRDSMYRESRKVSVKTTAKPQGARHAMEHVDSPRPLQKLQSVKPRISNLDGSSRFLNLHEAPRSSIEKRSPAYPPRDSPRLSYDERESRSALKNVMKLKELPRLSLDSRERSMKRSGSISGSDILLNGKISSQNLQTPQEPGSNKRLSGVVAKLMGLEALPEPDSSENDQARKIISFPHEDLGKISNLSRKGEESKQNKVSRSPRMSKREPASPRLTGANSQLKQNSKSSLGPKAQKQEMQQEAQTQAQKLLPSVYGAIEKRLNEIEFKRSGKDLRALKQILEAMQKSTERLDQKKEDHATDMEPQISNQGPELRNFDLRFTSEREQSKITPIVKEASSQKNLEITSVIIKDAAVSRKTKTSGPFAVPLEGISSLHRLRTRGSTDSSKDSIEKQIAKERTLRKNHSREPSYQPKHLMDKSAKALRSMKTSKTLNHVSGGSPSSPRMSPIIVIPRLQQNPPAQPSDTSSYGMLSGRQQRESGSPSRDFMPNSPYRHVSDDKLSKCYTDTRRWDQQDDAILAQSNEITVRLKEDSTKAEPTTASLEQPSPVSVLDATFYIEESPSPVKKISYDFKDEETANSVEEELDCADLYHLPRLSQQFGLGKPEDMKSPTHSLRQVISAHVEVAHYVTTSLLEDTNPEHTYIAEILFESGLLFNNLTSGSIIIQLQRSVHLINPNLFLFLEKTKEQVGPPDHDHSDEKNNRSEFNEKFQRKLIFDTVSEIIARKLTSPCFLEPWVSPTNLKDRNFDGKKLLKEVCSEVDCLLAKPGCSIADEDDDLIGLLRDDMVRPEEDWLDYRTSVPGLVLDIERLVFKDLINELVTGELASLKSRATKHRRQLFT